MLAPILVMLPSTRNGASSFSEMVRRVFSLKVSEALSAITSLTCV